MKEYFDKRIVALAENYCKSKYPEEACGFIVDNDFIPLENIAENKIEEFKIKDEDYIKYFNRIKCIIHSHADYSHISESDMLGQHTSAIPWGVVFLNNGTVENTLFFGDQLPIQDLIGRPFVHGIYDCWGLVRDYYRLKGYKDLPNPPRDNLWWEYEKSNRLIMDNYRDAGFSLITKEELRKDDMLVMTIEANIPNHTAVYTGNGMILHHLYGKFSREDNYYRWKDSVSLYLRLNNA